MSQYWSATVHSLTPYVPGEQPKIDNLVKLNTNEHPLGPSPRVLEAIKNASNDRLALAGAVASVEDDAYFRESCATVIATREQMVANLEGLGFEVLPSAANFVFARHPAHRGAKLASGLRERAIIVRHFKLPRIDEFLRITVGTPEQCNALVQALKALLQSQA